MIFTSEVDKWNRFCCSDWSILDWEEVEIARWSCLIKPLNFGNNTCVCAAGVEAVAGWFYEHLEGSVQIVAIQTSGESDSSAVDETFLQTHLSRLSISDGKSKTLEVYPNRARTKIYCK